MEPEKAYVRPDQTTVIKCPHCKRASTISVEKFGNAKKILKIKCSCKESFSISLEFRRQFRKQTDLPGVFTNFSKKNTKGQMTVSDVSMGGIGFTLLGINEISPEDELLVRFNLDDANQSLIERRVVVRIVRGKFVGCEFADMNEYNKALGFYLMP